MIDHHILLQTAVLASLKGAREIMAVYHKADPGVRLKEDATPVTEADMRSNRVIECALGSTGIPIISEEGKDLSFSHRSGWNRFWLVDPLDGTKEFIKHNGQFTVNIALIENGIPTIGISFIPVKGWLYCGVNGLSYKYSLPDWQDADDSHFLSKASMVTLPYQSTSVATVVVSSSHPSSATARYIGSLEESYPGLKVEQVGSSLKLCLLAEGSANIYPRIGTTMEWDTAAGDVILRNAGGAIVRMSDFHPLEYNKENLRNPDFVAVTRDFLSIIGRG
jgi:3'(2'), 5'-bisphosphate nucleotidase